MKKLVVFTGESGSGKTTLIARLTERYPERFRKVVTCTSRPLRTEEVNGIDYHFLPAEYFIENNKLVLVNYMPSLTTHRWLKMQNFFQEK